MDIKKPLLKNILDFKSSFFLTTISNFLNGDAKTLCLIGFLENTDISDMQYKLRLTDKEFKEFTKDSTFIDIECYDTSRNEITLTFNESAELEYVKSGIFKVKDIFNRTFTIRVGYDNPSIDLYSALNININNDLILSEVN